MGFLVLFYSCHCPDRHISVMCFRHTATVTSGVGGPVVRVPQLVGEVFKEVRYRRRDVAALEVLSM